MLEVIQKAQLAKQASLELAEVSGKQRNKLLQAMAKALIANSTAICKANSLDMARGKKNKMSDSLLDRLMLNEKRIEAMAKGLEIVRKLPDPVGKILRKTRSPRGMRIVKISVPFGVIGMIYEARPNVTGDAAGLCIKAGSAVVLRGGSAAASTNKTIVSILRAAIKSCGVTPEIIQLIESPDRKAAEVMMGLNQYIDLLIPRGGAGLIQTVVDKATIPVIETGTGNCHVYVDRSADLKKALRIAYNAKVQRPSVCNAMETLLVHQDVAAKFLPEIIKQYQDAGVIIHGCPITKKYGQNILTATAKDYATEYLALEVAIRVVKTLDEALEHIRTYGSKHTEAIVARDNKAIKKFLNNVDASTVIANASTRFTDGGEFGLGCEIGISTQKLHARGPMGLPEITTYKYLVYGNGQIRK